MPKKKTTVLSVKSKSSNKIILNLVIGLLTVKTAESDLKVIGRKSGDLDNSTHSRPKGSVIGPASYVVHAGDLRPITFIRLSGFEE